MLREEAFTEIGLLIQRDAGILVERWCRRAIHEQPNAKRVHHKILRDQFGPLLKEMGRCLAEVNTEDGCHHQLLATEHGEQRWNAGWSLAELVRDYQILRVVVLESLEEGLERPMTMREMMAVGLTIDDSIMASVGMYVTYRDEFTRQAERQRTESERRSADELRRWEQVFEYASWGVAVVDQQRHTLSALNPGLAKMHGYTPAELRGQPLSMLVSSDEQSRLPEHIARAVELGHHSFESIHVRRDGSTLTVLTSLSAVHDVDSHDAVSKVSQLAANFQDISERKKLEQSLIEQAASAHESDRRKDEFLAMLAHELRNPLAPILNAIELIRLSGGDADVVEESLTITERQVQQLVRLVDDLLDVARISQGKLTLRKSKIDVAQAVHSAVESCRPLIDSRGHQLTLALPERPIRVNVDPARLEQVLTNLLNNAAKYTKRGGHIWLSAEQDDSGVIIRVRDNGVGMGPDLLPRVFDLFTQSDRSAQGGLGVGLTLVRRLVEMHGGSVSASSPGVGRGSEFCVRLPALPAGVAETADRLQGKAAVGAKKARLLLVDDNKDVVGMLALLLRKVGHEVDVAHDGPDALAAARACVPDVILLDIGLPGMDGYQVAVELRKDQRLRQCWLVAMTGYGQDEDVRRAQEAGFHHHLLKPVHLGSIQEVLARHERQSR